MMSGPARSGSLYWLTSVPQTPAISTFISAASAGISGRSISRNSVVDAAVLSAARDFSDTRSSSGPLGSRDCIQSPRTVSTCRRRHGAPLERGVEPGVRLPDVALEDLPAIVLGQPVERVETRLVVVEHPPGERVHRRHAAQHL